MDALNLGNSIFKNYNDQNSIMICGYEWGWSKADETDYEKGNYEELSLKSIPHTFANKARYYGERAHTWKYDNVIKKWFELWGHPLDTNDLGGAFEKSLVQTNWAATQNNKIQNYADFLNDEQIDNFIYHVDKLKPRIILFMGSNLISFLNNPRVLPRFEKIMGNIIEPMRTVQKSYDGIRFKVRFEKFEKCETICFPHPSASRGLSYEYIELFSPEMSKILNEFKTQRNFS